MIGAEASAHALAVGDDGDAGMDASTCAIRGRRMCLSMDERMGRRDIHLHALAAARDADVDGNQVREANDDDDDDDATDARDGTDDDARERIEWMGRFMLLVNKLGQTRLARYYDGTPTERSARNQLEGEIVRRCLARGAKECSFVEHREFKLAYRRYASLFFNVGCDGEENELAMLEFAHCAVETLDRHFGNVCELDIMMHLDKVHCILEEMVMCGEIVETNKLLVTQEACKQIDVQEKGYP